MGIQYTPGATRLEVIQMFRLAAMRGMPVFTHVRSFGRLEPGSSIEAVSEVIGAAAATGASLHIVHINSSCVADAPECLSMIAGARARGLDVTTEAYPYIAGFTSINSALFQSRVAGKARGGLRRAAAARFRGTLDETALRSAPRPDPAPTEVLIFMNTEWEMVDSVIANPLVMIASDGEDGHPRNAGTFSRILARYVRERGSITLMDALRKMSLMPAERLAKSAPAAHRKGRLQEGADADIVAFNPQNVRGSIDLPGSARAQCWECSTS